MTAWTRSSGMQSDVECRERVDPPALTRVKPAPVRALTLFDTAPGGRGVSLRSAASSWERPQQWSVMTVVGATALLATALRVMAIAAVAACAVSISHWVPLSSERSLKADDCFSLDHFVNSLPLVTRDDGETRSESAKSSTSVFSATGRAWTICRWRPSSARSLTQGSCRPATGRPSSPS